MKLRFGTQIALEQVSVNFNSESLNVGDVIPSSEQQSQEHKIACVSPESRFKLKYMEKYIKEWMIQVSDDQQYMYPSLVIGIPSGAGSEMKKFR